MPLILKVGHEQGKGSSKMKHVNEVQQNQEHLTKKLGTPFLLAGNLNRFHFHEALKRVLSLIGCASPPRKPGLPPIPDLPGPIPIPQAPSWLL